ncbi:hypothetical protein JAAARDRAFT_49711 [Jaapia argillacea MUCL 33604]|uniref:Uncharacterized protein n=1 Tax=Jaapia argillacea MUCL 33604 TaxID=933084 RepID=A0A067PT38_9AGAM|nr:hypothetical protein JAAARDRAFT_49711 [Jaapia argillacea MUCL 33604]
MPRVSFSSLLSLLTAGFKWITWKVSRTKRDTRHRYHWNPRPFEMRQDASCNFEMLEEGASCSQLSVTISTDVIQVTSPSPVAYNSARLPSALYRLSAPSASSSTDLLNPFLGQAELADAKLRAFSMPAEIGRHTPFLPCSSSSGPLPTLHEDVSLSVPERSIGNAGPRDSLDPAYALGMAYLSSSATSSILSVAEAGGLQLLDPTPIEGGRSTTSKGYNITTKNPRQISLTPSSSRGTSTTSISSIFDNSYPTQSSSLTSMGSSSHTDREGDLAEEGFGEDFELRTLRASTRCVQMGYGKGVLVRLNEEFESTDLEKDLTEMNPEEDSFPTPRLQNSITQNTSYLDFGFSPSASMQSGRSVDLDDFPTPPHVVSL